MLPYVKVLVSATLILFATLGLGRFSFGMILPNLQENLNITTTQAGFIGTANFLGYFLGILFVAKLYNSFETHKLIPTALFLQGSTLLAMSLTHHYLGTSFFYFLSGIFSSIVNVSVMVYISHIIPENKKGKALGIIITGNGMGIIFSGMVIPIVHQFFQTYSWRVNWAIFAFIIMGIAFYIRTALKMHQHNHSQTQRESLLKVIINSKFWKIAVLYIIFGITYSVFITFFILASIHKYHLSTYESGTFWTILGVMSLVSGPLFGTLCDKIGGYKTLVFIYAIQTVALLIMVLQLPVSTLYVSAVLFGLTAWSIPSIITLLTSQEFGKNKTAQIFSYVTLLFALGQAIAPLGAGFLHDYYGNFSLVFALCTLFTLVGCLFAFFATWHNKKNFNKVNQ